MHCVSAKASECEHAVDSKLVAYAASQAKRKEKIKRLSYSSFCFNSMAVSFLVTFISLMFLIFIHFQTLQQA